MSSLKAFEDATLWRPTSLAPVRTTEPVVADVPAMACAPFRTDTPATPASVRSPQFKTEKFMMYGFKICMCSRAGRHKWDECPFAHPTENARRRDPRLFSYSCHECPSYRNTGYCAKGDSCEYSHGIFEARLHPDSFRTVACKDGNACRRKICFFYHSEEEKRVPTGLHEARAQITAELGESAFDLTGDHLRAVANNLLTSSPSISSTIQELNTSMSQPICQNQSVRSVISMSAASPLATSRSTGAANLSTAFSGLTVSASNSGVLMGQDTVAPCLKGANRNKAKVRELAAETSIHPEALMNALRVSALQGEFAPQSVASSLSYGAFSPAVEGILQELSASEDLPIDKLRGWLQRQMSPRCPSPGSPTRNFSPFTPSNSASPDTWHRPDSSGHHCCSMSPQQSTRQGSASPRVPSLVSHDEAIRAYGSGAKTARYPSKQLSWHKSVRSGSDSATWRPMSARASSGPSDDTRW